MDDDDIDDPAPGGPSYAFKPSMMGGPHAFTLGPETLHWELGRHSGRIPYTAIRRIRLSYRPANLATHRFAAELWSELAPKLTIYSTTWRSLVEMRRQDADYAAFVRELVRRVGEAGGDVRFETGSAPALYWPGFVLCAALAVALPWMLVRALLDGSMGGAAIVAALMALFVWQVGTFFWRNRPGVFQPAAVPPTVLPRGR